MYYFSILYFYYWANKLYLRWSCTKSRLICSKIAEFIYKYSRLFRFFMAKCMDSLLLFLVVCMVSICWTVYCKNILWQVNSRISNRSGIGSNLYCFHLDGRFWQCSHLSRIYGALVSEHCN